jgi:hypothetical protein
LPCSRAMQGSKFVSAILRHRPATLRVVGGQVLFAIQCAAFCYTSTRKSEVNDTGGRIECAEQSRIEGSPPQLTCFHGNPSSTRTGSTCIYTVIWQRQTVRRSCTMSHYMHLPSEHTNHGASYVVCMCTNKEDSEHPVCTKGSDLSTKMPAIFFSLILANLVPARDGSKSNTGKI